MPTLSVIIPVYRDATTIERTFEIVKQSLEGCFPSVTHEIILVNDGSPDRSKEAIEAIHERYPHIAGAVNLVRNYGQVAAILAGMQVAKGDCIAAISSDLQDPPELITRFLKEWTGGADAVIGVRETRDDPLPNIILSRIFYSLMRRFALTNIPRTGFDCFLVDRTVAERILSHQERNMFLQGMILESSARIVRIPYHRRARRMGKSGWTAVRKIKYFVDGFVGYSFMPIRLITVAGLVMFFLGLVTSVLIVAQKVLYGTQSIGWSSIMAVMLFLHGVEMFMLGVLGEYLWRALDQVRPRPLYEIDWAKLPSTDRNAELKATGNVLVGQT
jgi:dolichol-phosphate mannosyltransferase